MRKWASISGCLGFEAASPWEPLHVERGFQCEDSTVTVYSAEAPHNSNNHGSQNARDLLGGRLSVEIYGLGGYVRVTGDTLPRISWPRWVGVPLCPVVAVQHPLAALAPEAVIQRADAVVERIIEQLMTTH